MHHADSEIRLFTSGFLDIRLFTIIPLEGCGARSLQEAAFEEEQAVDLLEA